MKNSSLFIIFFSLIMIIGCTKSFDTRNTDPTRISEEDLNLKDLNNLFTTSLYAGMNAGNVNGVDYQRPQNLFADDYCQYFASTQTAFNSDRYNIVQSWVQYQWKSTYVASLPSLMTIIERTNEEESFAGENAIARIWKVFVLHRTTDYFGPVPYFEIGSDSNYIAYNAQKDIYYDFFKELEEATNILKDRKNSTSFGDGSSDKIFQGDNGKWYVFANSLRLRLALRISNVEPDKAREEAEKAVEDGVMEENDQGALLEVSGPDNFNGLARISDWNEFRMSSTMESLLVGYADPRLEKYFDPAEATGLFKGVRNGMDPGEQVIPENDYSHASNLNASLRSDHMFDVPQTVMYAAEMYFLRAEGALNHWDMGGAPQDLYEAGMERSLKFWGINNASEIENYKNSMKLPSAPGGYFQTPALTDIPVKFSSNEEIQREQIGTQKYLALFPDGMEAWAEMRRSGFPKRYPLIHSDNRDLKKDELIRRIPFLDYSRDKNEKAVEDAVNLLNGPDNAATPLWWDVN